MTCVCTCTIGSVVYVYVVVGDSKGVSRDVSGPLSLDSELVDVCDGDWAETCGEEDRRGRLDAGDTAGHAPSPPVEARQKSN